MVKADLIKIGYWYSEREPNLPMPDVGYDPVDSSVIEYLEQGDVLEQYRGFSGCRICGFVPNGSRCLTDGIYQWPEGLAHYVREHSTPLPIEFLDHISRYG